MLGAMMLSSEAIADVVELLQPEDFYRSANARIYEALRGIYAKGEPVDLITAVEEPEAAGQSSTRSAVRSISRDLVEQVPTPASAGHYARIVAQTALLRRLISAAADIMEMAYAAPEDPEGVADDAEQRIYDVARREDKDEVAVLRDLVDEAMIDLESIQNRDSAYTGLPTGFRDLDDLMSGLQPGNLIIIAARPGVGKSSLAMNMARNVAVDGKSGRCVLAGDVALRDRHARCCARRHASPGTASATSACGPDDWTRIVHAAEALHDAPLIIVDSGNVNIVDIRAKARRMRTGRTGLDLIIVDYLQLMSAPNTRRPDNRQQEVAEISRSLKLLAKELSIPVSPSPAEPQPGIARGQATAALGPPGVGCHRAGQRRRHVHPSRRQRSRA